MIKLNKSSLILPAIVIGFGSPNAGAEIPDPIPVGDIEVGLELIADGLTHPVFATHAGDRTGRLFVVEQIGLVRIIDADGNLLPTPFLDLTAEIVTPNPFFDERGFLGLAFHPNYRKNGRFFVRYSKPRAAAPGEGCAFGFFAPCHEEILAEYRVSDDPNVADPASQRILFRIDEPEFNHDSGQVAFGPFPHRAPRSDRASRRAKSKNHLYFTLGDGGGANDGLPAGAHGPIGNGQNIDTALGSILRIDVDSPPDPGKEYAVPEDNPFVGKPGMDEIYAYGLRNPYRFSFDDGPGGDGRLFLGDVGQNLFEEINIIERGGNYGWVIREGFHCFDPSAPLNPPADCPDTGPNGEPLLDPIAEYHHQDGIAVIGGFVYRGARIPDLRGKYVFADFAQAFSFPSGRVFWLDADGDTSQVFELLHDPLNAFVLGMAEDEAGDLYVLGSGSLGPTGTTGRIWRIVAP